jgi:membrane-associated phospholipid phosphatase
MNVLFDPKLNHFLQSFQTPFLTVLMLAVSLFGSQQFLMLAGGFMFFRAGWNRGFVFVQMLLLSFIFTDFLKEFLHLPRPIQVDPTLESFNEYLPRALVESVADNPGFPSGHVCSTVVFWGSLLIIYPGRLQKIIGITLIGLMSISRMYLGRHFLGDVLGGFFLGSLILLAAFATLIRSHQDPSFPNNKNSAQFIGYLLLPLVLNFLPYFPPGELGELFGFNIAIYYLLSLRFFETSSSSGITKFLIAVLVFVLFNVVLSKLHIYPNQWVHFFIAAIPMCFAVLAAEISGKVRPRVGI